MINKPETKLGKYAIPRLINCLLLGYGIGYMLIFIEHVGGAQILNMITLEPYNIIHGFQFWRIITWVFIPPLSGSGIIGFILALIMIYCYWQPGKVLEKQWGACKFNLYIFGGIIITLIGSFLYYYGYSFTVGAPLLGAGGNVGTSYINMSIFLALAMSFPEKRVIYFDFPLK